eukprot:TRINITY_DN4883_c0_g1_i10.p1 TRINITY_DN4883_c0_g1~~TRINITY_DN4883_c0_g1_i10.p1  ORF type:complete len:1032 (+),score=199.38 TRINITY_DN4883_c0_g1_i10:1696-4791(+)
MEDAFPGYTADTVPSLVLAVAAESGLADGAAGDEEQQQQQLLMLCKLRLLQAACASAVIRCEGSANQCDAEWARRIYFGGGEEEEGQRKQQSHQRGLAGLLRRSAFSAPLEGDLFTRLAVTTFSSMHFDCASCAAAVGLRARCHRLGAVESERDLQDLVDAFACGEDHYDVLIVQVDTCDAVEAANVALLRATIEQRLPLPLQAPNEGLPLAQHRVVCVVLHLGTPSEREARPAGWQFDYIGGWDMWHLDALADVSGLADRLLACRTPADAVDPAEDPQHFAQCVGFVVERCFVSLSYAEEDDSRPSAERARTLSELASTSMLFLRSMRRRVRSRLCANHERWQLSVACDAAADESFATVYEALEARAQSLLLREIQLAAAALERHGALLRILQAERKGCLKHSWESVWEECVCDESVLSSLEGGGQAAAVEGLHKVTLGHAPRSYEFPFFRVVYEAAERLKLLLLTDSRAAAHCDNEERVCRSLCGLLRAAVPASLWGLLEDPDAALAYCTDLVVEKFVGSPVAVQQVEVVRRAVGDPGALRVHCSCWTRHDELAALLRLSQCTAYDSLLQAVSERREVETCATSLLPTRCAVRLAGGVAVWADRVRGAQDCFYAILSGRGNATPPPELRALRVCYSLAAAVLSGEASDEDLYSLTKFATLEPASLFERPAILKVLRLVELRCGCGVAEFLFSYLFACVEVSGGSGCFSVLAQWQQKPWPPALNFTHVSCLVHKALCVARTQCCGGGDDSEKDAALLSWSLDDRAAVPAALTGLSEAADVASRGSPDAPLLALVCTVLEDEYCSHLYDGWARSAASPEALRERVSEWCVAAASVLYGSHSSSLRTAFAVALLRAATRRAAAELCATQQQVSPFLEAIGAALASDEAGGNKRAEAIVVFALKSLRRCGKGMSMREVRSLCEQSPRSPPWLHALGWTVLDASRLSFDPFGLLDGGDAQVDAALQAAFSTGDFTVLRTALGSARERVVLASFARNLRRARCREAREQPPTGCAAKRRQCGAAARDAGSSLQAS